MTAAPLLLLEFVGLFEPVILVLHHEQVITWRKRTHWYSVMVPSNNLYINLDRIANDVINFEFHVLKVAVVNPYIKIVVAGIWIKFHRIAYLPEGVFDKWLIVLEIHHYPVLSERSGEPKEQHE
jgi:hypothetical protein